MASKGPVWSLIRRELRPSSLRTPRVCASLSTIANPLGSLSVTEKRKSHRAGLFARTGAQCQVRPFSKSSSKALTDEHGNFDPRQLERESDEVDVIIVGAGAHKQVIM